MVSFRSQKCARRQGVAVQRRHTFDVGFYREGRKAEPLERAQSSCSGRSGPVQRRGSGTKGRRGDDETIGGFARTTRRGDDSLVGLSKRCAGLRASFAIPGDQKNQRKHKVRGQGEADGDLLKHVRRDSSAHEMPSWKLQNQVGADRPPQGFLGVRVGDMKPAEKLRHCCTPDRRRSGPRCSPNGTLARLHRLPSSHLGYQDTHAIGLGAQAIHR